MKHIEDNSIFEARPGRPCFDQRPIYCIPIGPAAYKDFTWVSCDVYWNSFDQSYEGEKEHIMPTVFAISLQGANQHIPFHDFQFSYCTPLMLDRKLRKHETGLTLVSLCRALILIVTNSVLLISCRTIGRKCWSAVTSCYAAAGLAFAACTSP